ncbi:MAG: hypothetical protein Q4E06_06565 [Lautropia sp.]|nr:hypothetical protein [Lautropia sp.]
MISNSYKSSATLLALLMLAGCGGGADSGNAPASQASHRDPDALTQTADTAGSALSTKAPGAIAARDISAELLAALLTHGSTGNGKVDEFRAFPAYPWNGPGPHGSMRRDAAGHIPLLHGGQDLFPLRGMQPDYRFRLGSWFGHDDSVPGFDFGSLDTELQVTMTSGLYGPQTRGSQHQGSSPIAGETLFTLGPSVSTRVRNGTYAADSAPADQRELKADTPYTAQAGQRIPIDQVLHTWRDDQGNFVELLVLSGARRDQIRLCLNQHVPTIKRLNCTIWQVPATWKPGGELGYKGIYVVDDRSPRENTRRLLYWQSTDRVQSFAAPPVSSRGVRGDFLAAVLSTDVTAFDDTGRVYPIWSAAGLRGPSPRAGLLGDPMMPVIDGWTNGNLPDDADTGLSHSFVSFISEGSQASDVPLKPFADAEVQLPFTPLAGRYFPSSWQPADEPVDSIYVPGRLLFSANGVPAPGAGLLRLDNTAHARVTNAPRDGQSAPSTQVPLQGTGEALILRHGEVVPMYRRLQRWQNGEHFAELLLLDSYQRNQFRLCINHHLPQVKRLTCSIWEAPDDWALDKVKPHFKGIYVNDDRSTVGEAGNLYWQTDPARARQLKSLRTKALRRGTALQQGVPSAH